MTTATLGYMGLVEKFRLRPLRKDRDLDRAVAVIDDLLANPKLTREQEDYLEVLTELVHKYEQSFHPIEPASDGAMLKHLMESHDMSRTELHKRTGMANSTISEVLTGKRTLTRKQIATLSQMFHVSADAFAAQQTKSHHRG